MGFNYTGKLFLSQSVFQPWKSVSTLAKSFIDRLLTLEPEHRMTAEETLKHPWLVSMAACSSNKNLHRSISRNLQRRASRASSRGPSSGSTPGSRVSMRSGSQPGSWPRLGLATGHNAWRSLLSKFKVRLVSMAPLFYPKALSLICAINSLFNSKDQREMISEWISS